VLNGILWVLRTGAAWQDLPDRYPSPATCHRRFRLKGAVTSQEWRRAGVLEKILQRLARDLKERGDLDLSECFIDGFFVVAKKGAGPWERPNAAKVRRSWRWQTALVFLSPFTLKVLRQMKSPLWGQLSHLDLSWQGRNA
jgi:hypothetical protein